ncbi:hypothetical protein CDL15_Pgr022293 [Punica granatum]|uniref:Uncharacterized protein n=1 Tax=Punica granatum TaxID=22663 RepID=A0A218WPU5_PUNGR|nr:hypothetical protein CDL15_Pgr022293 [Punica granatum]
MAFTWPGTATTGGYWMATEAEKVAVIADVLARLFETGSDWSRLDATVREGTRLFATGRDGSRRDATGCDCLRRDGTDRDYS